MADIVTEFYEAFKAKDGDAMAACYSDDIVFEDPAFGELSGADPGDMWRMLCSSDTALDVSFTVLRQDEKSATVNWLADYTFGPKKVPVHNDVTASLTLRDGKIVDHRDRFDFWKWSAQALGTPGKLLGWSPILKSKVRKGALKNLRTFQAS